MPLIGVTVFLCGMAIALLRSSCHAPTVMLANFIATPIEFRLNSYKQSCCIMGSFFFFWIFSLLLIILFYLLLTEKFKGFNIFNSLILKTKLTLDHYLSSPFYAITNLFNSVFVLTRNLEDAKYHYKMF